MIKIQKGLANELHKHLNFGNKYAIITDSTVKDLFAKKIASQLKNHGIKTEIFSFPKGEKSKFLQTVETLAEQMVNKKFDRRDAVICLGGGVVGDIGGFLASIYMRGIPCIQMPTTLLAMVDSAIGGKNGVDLQGGKNLLGTITQPNAILVDPNFLEKLPEKQIKSGLAEVIKYGVILDKKFFKFLEDNMNKILKKDEKAIAHIIKKSIDLKTKIVKKDEKEAGLRMILNYGHTYGHALEKNSNFTLLHGFAISIGMVIANKIAFEKNYLSKNEADRIRALLKKTGLPTTTVKMPTKEDLLSDKKCQGGYIHFVLPTKIGKVTIHKEKCI
jgi:3-dehydroquinate synthase